MLCYAAEAEAKTVAMMKTADGLYELSSSSGEGEGEGEDDLESTLDRYLLRQNSSKLISSSGKGKGQGQGHDYKAEVVEEDDEAEVVDESPDLVHVNTDNRRLRNKPDRAGHSNSNSKGEGSLAGGGHSIDDCVDSDGAMADLQCMLAEALMESGHHTMKAPAVEEEDDSRS
jgi:hypothetical protein